MDPLNLCIALGPLAVYLLLLGLIGLSSRPFLTSGFRDGATLAIWTTISANMFRKYRSSGPRLSFGI